MCSAVSRIVGEIRKITARYEEMTEQLARLAAAAEEVTQQRSAARPSPKPEPSRERVI
ncbi:hypothetical protein GCM10009727_44980 [Actinomadura napierensis]|uniref:Uncharacterized protein n=1 Tax=Actinomadura napierensis TaxID=267854 RepID=A0ABP5LET4_9ACTN